MHVESKSIIIVGFRRLQQRLADWMTLVVWRGGNLVQLAGSGFVNFEVIGSNPIAVLGSLRHFCELEISTQ